MSNAKSRLPSFLADHVPITAEQERELVTQAQAGSRRAGDALVRAHMPYVTELVRRRTRAFPSLFEDALGAALAGFSVALGRFDLSRGVRLLTYATWWMTHHVGCELERATISGHSPSGSEERVLSASRKLRTEDVDVLTQATGVQRATVETALVFLHQGRYARSLDMCWTTKEGKEWTLHDHIADDGPTPEDTALAGEDAAQATWDADVALEALSGREREIVRWCVIGDEDGVVPVAEAGRRLCVSRERARQILARAVAKMRRELVGTTVPTKPWLRTVPPAPHGAVGVDADDARAA